MSNESNQETYTDRLWSLRHDVAIALSDAQYAGNHLDGGSEEDAAVTAYTNLWADLLNALIANADCDHVELQEVVAGRLAMHASWAAPVEFVEVGGERVPVVGIVGPDGNVSWNGSLAGGRS